MISACFLCLLNTDLLAVACNSKSIYFIQEDVYYDAFKEDLAILNVYFAQSTAIGNLLI